MATAKTYVYFNLHKHVWSVMLRGIVQRHSPRVTIRDADFVVRAAGHAKVLREKRKNVHSFVRGEDVSNERGIVSQDFRETYDTIFGEAVEISYNPYKGAHFYRKDTNEVVASARLIELRPDKTVWAWGLKNAE